MVDVPVNPDVLKWARTERRIGRREAAKLLGISVEDLDALESGSVLPNLSQLRTMSSKYEMQLASLLMPEPLPSTTRPRIHDFRTIGGRDADYGLDLITAIEDVAQQAEAFADLREVAPDLLPPPALPKYTRQEKPEAIARQERDRLGITVPMQLAWDGDRQAFLTWRQALENSGIFVFSNKLGNPRSCRGFSYWDERQIGIIVVNNEEDNYRARNFTLFHEYCHLLLRMCGISDENRKSQIERFCNKFAAYFLMPDDEFRREAMGVHRRGADWTEHHVNRLSTRFKVSNTAVTIHLEELHFVRQRYFDELRRELRLRRRRKGGGQSEPVQRFANRLGTHSVEVVLSALDRGYLNKLDAWEILEVRPDYFGDLLTEINGRKAIYGGTG